MMDNSFRRFKHLFILISLVAFFIAAFSLVANATSAPSATGKVDASAGARLRSKASTSSSTVATLNDNTKLTIYKVVYVTKTSTAAKNRWYYVSADGKKGYIRADLVDSIKHTAVSAKVTKTANYRVGPGTSMKAKGSLSKGKKILVYLKAVPVSSVKGSSSTWYKIKIGSYYRYICSANVEITGSIFEKTDDDTQSSSNKQNRFSSMSDEEFTAYLTEQGFTASYRKALIELHKSHPNWVFIAKKTGIDWDDALSKESANGVSLIYSSNPSSSPYVKPDYSSRTVYKKAGSTASSNKAGVSVSSNTSFTVYDEVWVDSSSSTTRWNHIKTSGGTKGYIKGSLSSLKPKYTVDGVVNADGVNVRAGASTKSSVKKSYDEGKEVDIVLTCKNSSTTWYKIKYGSSSYAYICAKYVDVPSELSSANLASLEGVVDDGAEVSSGVDNGEAAIDGQAALLTESSGEASPAVDNAVSDNEALNQDTQPNQDSSSAEQADGQESNTVSDGQSAEQKAEQSSESNAIADELEEIATLNTSIGLSDLIATGKFCDKYYTPRDGSTWYNANKATIAYYMDPRNFLNESRVYMFEDLSYQSDYQTLEVVGKILSGTQLLANGFTAKMFVDAGAKYDVSPVFLAARARQETGGGSIAITGYKINGTTVYNPFNIGAYSSSNPVLNGLKYAYNQGWTSRTKAVQGSAEYLAKGYINNKQNSIYYQKWNVAKGLSNVATHQYMTNIQAPYSEAYTTMKSYSSYGITDESLTFIIPVFSDMPASTELPS